MCGWRSLLSRAGEGPAVFLSVGGRGKLLWCRGWGGTLGVLGNKHRVVAVARRSRSLKRRGAVKDGGYKGTCVQCSVALHSTALIGRTEPGSRLAD